ncbi:DEAD/DEAH box helicase [Fulvivirgaceae bacterium LMO-SS25]
MQFQELNLSQPILNALIEEGYTNPTPIQEKAIPIVLSGKDLMGVAQTGTGKTAAFAIPIIELLNKRPGKIGPGQIRSLIVTPTRELAIQIDESFKAYGKNTELRTTVIFGGVKQFKQVNRINSGIDILVATPGRLLDLIGQGIISLSKIELFVLDEADRMLDMGFVNDVRKIVKLLPQKRQSLFFSATMPQAIVQLANSILHNPMRVEVTPPSSTADTVQQFIYFVDKGNKMKLLVDILNEKDIPTALVFTRTKHGADKVVRFLKKSNITAEAIHGNKEQNARQRALANFKAQTTRVLVATDIASRGIDIDDLQFVVNFELPNISETYVHRIGRTGRAGKNGIALSFCDASEKPYLKDIEKLISKSIAVIKDHPYPLMNHEVEPAPKQKQKQKRPANRNQGTGGEKPQGQKRRRY